MLTTQHAGTIKIFINERNARGDLPFIRIKPISAQSYIVPSDCSSQTRVVTLGHSGNLQCLIAHCRIHHVRTSMYAITSL
jgi:hypothetical protein